METQPRELPDYINVASEAVADAMTSIQYFYYHDFVEPEDVFKPIPADATERKKRLEEISLGMCRDSSVYVINYLFNKFPEEFTHFALLQGYSASDEPFKYNSNHQWHTYFLVKDRNNIWHAGSPANFNPVQQNSHMTRHLESENLSEIIGSIRDLDGGIWIDPEIVEREIELIPKPKIERFNKDAKLITQLTLATFDIMSHGYSTYDFETHKVYQNQNHFSMDRHKVICG